MLWAAAGAAGYTMRSAPREEPVPTELADTDLVDEEQLKILNTFGIETCEDFVGIASSTPVKLAQALGIDYDEFMSLAMNVVEHVDPSLITLPIGKYQ